MILLSFVLQSIRKQGNNSEILEYDEILLHIIYQPGISPCAINPSDKIRKKLLEEMSNFRHVYCRVANERHFPNIFTQN